MASWTTPTRPALVRGHLLEGPQPVVGQVSWELAQLALTPLGAVHRVVASPAPPRQ